MPNPNPKMSGGRIVDIRYEDDGIDLRISAGCGNPLCVNCLGAPECWTKIAPVNWPLRVGHEVRFNGETIRHLIPTARGFKASPAILRIGKYRRIRPDGTSAPAPTRCKLPDPIALAESRVPPAVIVPPNGPALNAGDPSTPPPPDDTPKAC